MVAPVPAQSQKLGPHLPRLSARPPDTNTRTKHLPSASRSADISPVLSSFHILPVATGGVPNVPIRIPPPQCLCGKSHVLSSLQPLLPLFALFSALPPFVFNRLQPLFPKHPGGGGYPNTSAPTFASAVKMRHVAPLSPVPSVGLCFHTLTNPFSRNSFAITSIQNPQGCTNPVYPCAQPPCLTRGPRCCSPCAGRKTVRRLAQTPPQPPMRPSPLPAAARARSVPNGIRQ